MRDNPRDPYRERTSTKKTEAGTPSASDAGSTCITDSSEPAKLSKKERNRIAQKKYYYKNRIRMVQKARKWREKNLERFREINRKSTRKWRANNPEKWKESSRKSTLKWKTNNPDKYAASLKKTWAKQRDKLSNGYLNKIAKVRYRTTVTELYPLIRAEILLKRELKKHKNTK